MTAFPLAPKPIHVPDAVLDDLRARLALTRNQLLREPESYWTRRSVGSPVSMVRQ